ncbi:MAG: hypothetical protein ACTSVR_04380 [Candidatus Thorarchaeota archaeon]
MNEQIFNFKSAEQIATTIEELTKLYKQASEDEFNEISAREQAEQDEAECECEDQDDAIIRMCGEVILNRLASAEKIDKQSIMNLSRLSTIRLQHIAMQNQSCNR